MLPRCFQVTLQADSLLVPDEALVGAGSRTIERAAGWQVEGLAVPVERHQPFRRRSPSGEPSAWLYLCSGHQPISAWRPGRTAAPAPGPAAARRGRCQDLLAGIQRRADQTLLRHQPGILRFVVDAHRPAHHHQQVEAVQGRQVGVGVEVADVLVLAVAADPVADPRASKGTCCNTRARIRPPPRVGWRPGPPVPVAAAFRRRWPGSPSAPGKNAGSAAAAR